MKDKRIEERIQHSLNAELSGLRTTSYQRDQFFENATGGYKVKRKISAVAILVAALMLITVTAFALTKGFGLLDFIGAHQEKEIPQNAEQYTLHELGTLCTDHFTVNIREGYYDGTTIHLIYDIIPKDKTILLLSNGPGMEESWYGITHLRYDSTLDDGRTILDRWNEGGFTSCWITDVNIEVDENMPYGVEAIWDEAHGMLTGQIEYPFSQLRTDRTLSFSFQASPLKNIQDENSMDYDRQESGVITLTLNSVYSGEERILRSTDPIMLKSVGAQIDQIRLIVLPAEIQYQISYSVTDPEKYHAVMDDESHSFTKPLSFRFVELTADGTVRRSLMEGISDPVGVIDDHVIIGYLGVSELYDEYTLAVYENTLEAPLEFVNVQVQYDNNWTWTPEERVWQQESDRSKPHNQADDTFVNPTSDDLPEAEAVTIARSAVIQAYGLPEGALDHTRTVCDMYVTNQRPDYRRWFIQFQVLKEGSESYVERVYSCIVDQEGKVIADPDIDESSLEEKAAAMAAALQKETERPDYVKKYLEYFRAHEDIGGFFWYWPYDDKAAYWQDMQPWINEVPLETDTEVGMTLYYAYGIPGADELQHDEAIRIARDLIKEKYQLSDAQMTRYHLLCEAFDISGKLYDGNVWKFVFVETGTYGSPNYHVVMDAKTGQAVIIEEFQWQEFKKDLEYDLKYY